MPAAALAPLLAVVSVPPLWGAPSSAALFERTEFWVTTGLLVAVILGGAMVIYFVDKWRKKQESDKLEAAEALTTFRAMYENGEISEAEYKAVRDRAAARLKDKEKVPATATAGAAETAVDVPAAPPTPPPPDTPPNPPA